MDRRQLKTRRAIFKAFRTLLETKRYDHITVQDIIDCADVGRSTFYAHFETKDMLLEAMCSEIFFHVFEYDPCPWSGKEYDLKGKLTHTLWHVKDSRSDLKGILTSDSGELFMNYFKKHITTLFEANIDSFSFDVPRDFLLNFLSSTVSEAVKWWVNTDFKESPEELGEYIMTLVKSDSGNN
ncbi:MAG: TetR family transcriptional regulator [Ruminococcaceae bacterium]|nr:TetR family transcriptional regulator [Oscillospiraceae bacterium]